MFVYGGAILFVWSWMDGCVYRRMYVEGRVEIQVYVLRCCLSLVLRQALFLT